jgi:hypothetical protein
MLHLMGGSEVRRDVRRAAQAAKLAGLAVLTAMGVVACAAVAQPGGPPGGGGPPPSSTTVPDSPATTMWGTPELPQQLVAVGDDGALVMVDTGTGERVVELAGPDGPGRAIRGVSLATDGATAYFDTRGAHGRDGLIYQVPTDGSAEPVQVATGTYPEVSPSGAQLAFVGQGEVAVHGIITDEVLSWPQTGRITDLSWTPDGTGLLWVRDRTELVWLDIDAAAEPQVVATVAAGERLQLPLGNLRNAYTVTVLVNSGLHDPTPERMMVTLDSEPTRGPDGMGLALDRSYHSSEYWGIRVTISHTIRWSGSGGVGTITAGYTAADF